MRAYDRAQPPGLRCSATARIFIYIVAIVLCIASWAASAAEHRRRIYFLESLAPTQLAAIRTIEAFQKRISEKTSESFDIFIDYMELERFPSQAHIASTVGYLSQKYSEAPPDLLIPLGRAAIPFMVKYRDIIAPGVPMIIANVPARAVNDGKTLANTVWVATEYNFAKTIELAQRLQPAARNLVIVAGASAYDLSWVNDAVRELEPFRDLYTVKTIVGLPYDETLTEVSHLSPDTIVLMSFVFADGAGLPRTPPDVAAAVAEAAAAPVYSPVSSFFGRGIVGGYTDSFEAHGTAAADLAFEILSGSPVAALKQQTEPLHRYQVDARQLERWKLSAGDLPPDTVISFRQPTMWEEHRALLLAAVAIFALQTTLLGFLLIQRRRRKQAEAEAAEQRHEVAHLMRVSVLGELSGTIAHEINQPLTAILSNAQAALHLLAQKSPNLEEVRDAINDIVHEDNRAGDVISRVRNLLRKGESKSEQVDLNELVTSTITLLNSELIGRRIEVETDLAGRLPATFGDPVQLQQVLLNLFMNAMDAMASTAQPQRRIKVSTRALEADAVEVRIRDRGHGIEAQSQAQMFKPFYTSKPHGLGLGLTICSTIAQAHGGKLGLVNHPDRGAVAVLSLPVQEFLAAAK
jgi:signal transduction histidine kinase